MMTLSSTTVIVLMVLVVGTSCSFAKRNTPSNNPSVHVINANPRNEKVVKVPVPVPIHLPCPHHKPFDFAGLAPPPKRLQIAASMNHPAYVHVGPAPTMPASVPVDPYHTHPMMHHHHYQPMTMASMQMPMFLIGQPITHLIPQKVMSASPRMMHDRMMHEMMVPPEHRHHHHHPPHHHPHHSHHHYPHPHFHHPQESRSVMTFVTPNTNGLDALTKSFGGDFSKALTSGLAKGLTEGLSKSFVNGLVKGNSRSSGTSSSQQRRKRIKPNRRDDPPISERPSTVNDFNQQKVDQDLVRLSTVPMASTVSNVSPAIGGQSVAESAAAIK